MPKFGGYTDVLVAPTSNIVKMPAAMSFEGGPRSPSST